MYGLRGLDARRAQWTDARMHWIRRRRGARIGLGRPRDSLMPTAEEMFRRWKALAGDELPRPWREENMAGFFQCFRPHGDGLATAFEGVVGADEILPRLMAVYQATANG